MSVYTWNNFNLKLFVFICTSVPSRCAELCLWCSLGSRGVASRLQKEQEFVCRKSIHTDFGDRPACWRIFPQCKGAQLSNICIWCRGLERVELYFPSPIHFNSVSATNWHLPFLFLMAGTHLWVGQWTFGFHKMRGISWLAAEPVSFSRRTLLHGVSM